METLQYTGGFLKVSFISSDMETLLKVNLKYSCMPITFSTWHFDKFARQFVFAFHLLSSSPLYICGHHSFHHCYSTKTTFKKHPGLIFVFPQLQLLHRNKRLAFIQKKIIKVKVIGTWMHFFIWSLLNEEPGPWRKPNLIFDKLSCCGSLNQKIARCLHFCAVNFSIGQQVDSKVFVQL